MIKYINMDHMTIYIDKKLLRPCPMEDNVAIL